MLTLDVHTDNDGATARQVIEDAISLCAQVNVRFRIDGEVIVDRSTQNPVEVAARLSRVWERRAREHTDSLLLGVPDSFRPDAVSRQRE